MSVEYPTESTAESSHPIPALPTPGADELWAPPEEPEAGEHEGMPETAMIAAAPAADLHITVPGARELYERLRLLIASYLSSEEQRLVERTCAFVAAAGTTPARLRLMLESGVILAEMHIDVTGVITGILQYLAIDPEHFTVDPAISERIAQEFGPETTILIESIARFSAIEQRKGKRTSTELRSSDLPGDRRMRERDAREQRTQVEKVRKMFIAMGNDPRIVIFKLAEHLQRMRERHVAPEEMRHRAQEARDLYAPLAGRLGMSRIESELEDLAFAQLDPDEYRRVQNLVAQARTEQRTYIDRVCVVLREEARRLGIKAEVSGRFKHLWSIYRKLVRNGWDIQQVYDLIAFRIIVPTTEDCYAMLGQVHALWPPKGDRIKDFIANRKPNGYQSLHTTVFCLENRLAEIQIRTREMHQNAEYGVAMHWYYKDVGDQAQIDKKLTRWLQQLRDWQADLQPRPEAEDDAATIQPASLPRQQIFVFTPHGDVKDLPAGSTPVDFAYRIHSDLGDHCVGAKIISTGTHMTPRLVPLDYVLDNGQIVQIMTRKDAHPTRDWLTFVRTHAARTHINRYLREHERDLYITVGRERLERDTKLAGLGSLEVIGEEALHLVMDDLDYETLDDLYAAIGGDTLRPSKVTQRLALLIEPATPDPKLDEPPKPVVPSTGTNVVLNLAGAGGLLARLANCCHPLYGDPVTGYISRGHGIVIHHEQCRSLKKLRERESERIVQVDWSQMGMDSYDAAVMITAADRTGLVRDVTQQIHEMKLNMTAFSTTTSRRGQATIVLTLQINDLRQLEEALARIRTIRDVIAAERDMRGMAG